MNEEDISIKKNQLIYFWIFRFFFSILQKYLHLGLFLYQKKKKIMELKFMKWYNIISIKLILSLIGREIK